MYNIEENPVIFHKSDFLDFREWIQLKLESITWQGRYKEDFEYFWNLFFVDGYSLKQVFGRFDYALKRVKIGPLIAWFKWLRDKFCCYAFIYKGVSVFKLAQNSEMFPSVIAQILRDYFMAKFPHMEDVFNHNFKVGNMASPSLHLKFEELNKQINIGSDFSGGYEDEIMPSVEVTLYDEWRTLLKKMERELYAKDSSLFLFGKHSFSEQLIFFRDLFAIIFIGAISIWGIKVGNEWYEKVLIERISVYEPQFRWLDKTLRFKEVKENTNDNKGFDLKTLHELEMAVKSKKENAVVEKEDERYVTETEVFITSLNSLHRNLDSVDLELSKYEEEDRAGYRDFRFGRGRMFRVMMNSVDSKTARSKLDALLEKYAVTQVDNVKPGQYVPGGVYYNLFVPRDNIKEFLAKVTDVDETIIYEHRARARTPAGKSRVFIWIKSV